MLTASESGASEQMTRDRIYSNEIYVFSRRLFWLWILAYLIYFESSVLCRIFRKRMCYKLPSFMHTVILQK